MKIYQSIDYMALSFPITTKTEKMLPEGDYSFEKIKSAIPLYPLSFLVHPIEARLFLGAPERVGKHVVYAGKSMQKLREYDIILPDLYSRFKENMARFGRIDLAIDVFDSIEMSPDMIQKRFLAGQCVTKIKGSKEIAENDSVETFYIGKLNSRNQKFRAYNKAIEQGVTDTLWTRLEYEKRKNADNWARAVLGEGQNISSVIKSSIDFPTWELWQKIFHAPQATIPRVSEKRDDSLENKIAWLITSVAPAIAKAIAQEAAETDNDKFSLENSRVVTLLNKAIEYNLKNTLIEAKLNEFSLSEMENEVTGQAAGQAAL